MDPDSVISGKARGALIEAMQSSLNTTGIDALYTSFDLDRFVLRIGSNKEKRASELVRRVMAKGDGAIVELVRLVDNRVRSRHKENSTDYTNFLDALRLDGLQLVEGAVVPIDEDNVPAAEELGATMKMLQDLGWHDTLTYYRQAINAFDRGDFHACNGQLRTFLESLLRELCDVSGIESRQEPKADAQRLLNAKAISRDEKDLLVTIVTISNSNGAHPGATSQDEARFRLLLVATTTRWLLISITGR
ncbi:hypothetical protein [Arthrobacter sp. HLT1-21]